jgi:uncharacterized protein YndB with AHSA1/START domain
VAASTSTAAKPAAPELTITRLLDAPCALVFKAWTEPEHLARWWGARNFTLTSCKMDLRPGGAFRFSMRGPDGKAYPHQGVYRQIKAPERLVFTWAWEDEEGRPGHETLVTVTFTDEDGKTRLDFHQAVFATVSSRDGHEDGWMECFDRLAAYLASP